MPKSVLRAVVGRVQFTLHAIRRTPHGASRLVQATSAWLAKTRRAPSRHSRDARVYGHTATAMHNLCALSPPPLLLGRPPPLSYRLSSFWTTCMPSARPVPSGLSNLFPTEGLSSQSPSPLAALPTAFFRRCICLPRRPLHRVRRTSCPAKTGRGRCYPLSLTCGR